MQGLRKVADMTDSYPIPDFLRTPKPFVRVPIERPMLFSAPMVRALLAGTKTQTRRVVKPQPPEFDHATRQHQRILVPRCPYGQPGDRLWVRESTAEDCIGSASFARYTADGFTSRLAWWYSKKACPSIHMPRWASRILLEITAVRVERLQDISKADAMAEGLYQDQAGRWTTWSATKEHREHLNPIEAYRELWESINGAGSWGANPWVWAVEFRRI